MMHPASTVLAVFLVNYLPTALAQSDTLKEVVAGQDDLSTLSSVLTKAGFDDVFDDPNSNPTTLCSPNNDAFDKLPEERLTQLLEDQFVAHLRDVLEFHGVPGKVFAEQVTDGLVAPTLNDQELTFEFVEDPVTMMTLVFIRTPNTEGSQVIEVNLEASNGIAHKVDSVLLPNFWDKNLPTTIDRLDDDKYSIFKDLYALSSDNLNLENAVGTVLAPINEAMLDEFGGQSGVDALMMEQADDERDAILAAHIILDKVLPSDNLEDASQGSVEALDGSKITISTETMATGGQKITFNDITVNEADQLANNGLIHGINGVLSGATMPSPSPTTSGSMEAVNLWMTCTMVTLVGVISSW